MSKLQVGDAAMYRPDGAVVSTQVEIVAVLDDAKHDYVVATERGYEFLAFKDDIWTYL